jgi:type II secretory pathway pseudopilin PulG
MELLTSMLVIAILTLLMIPAYQEVRNRLDAAACTNNLRQLYTGANAYIQDYGHWPQISPGLLQAPNDAYDQAWIAAFMPFGIDRGTWICPTMERDLGGPDYTQRANYRSDYAVMPFDSKRLTPFTWPTAPWFVERGNVHGSGNLMIQANGSVVPLISIVPKPASSGFPSP